MKKRSAFTLIELLIVVAIIAILALIAVPNFLEAQTRAKTSRAKADMRSLSVALQAYRVDYNQYPPDVDSGAYPRMHDDWGNEIASYHMITTPVAYMTSIPLDPFNMSENRIHSGMGIAMKNLSYFEYSEENLEDARNPSKAAQLHASQCGFVIISMGPDRYGDFSWSGQEWLAVGRREPTRASGGHQRCIMYDPTNGTVSYGDVICSAKGLYGGGGG